VETEPASLYTTWHYDIARHRQTSSASTHCYPTLIAQDRMPVKWHNRASFSSWLLVTFCTVLNAVHPTLSWSLCQRYLTSVPVTCHTCTPAAHFFFTGCNYLFWHVYELYAGHYLFPFVTFNVQRTKILSKWHKLARNKCIGDYTISPHSPTGAAM